MTSSRFHRLISRTLRRPLSPILPVLLAAALLLTGACSNRAMYDAIQQNRLQACEELPIPQQASCKARYQTDYDEYRRQRDAASAPD